MTFTEDHVKAGALVLVVALVGYAIYKAAQLPGLAADAAAKAAKVAADAIAKAGAQAAASVEKKRQDAAVTVSDYLWNMTHPLDPYSSPPGTPLPSDTGPAGGANSEPGGIPL